MPTLARMAVERGAAGWGELLRYTGPLFRELKGLLHGAHHCPAAEMQPTVPLESFDGTVTFADGRIPVWSEVETQIQRGGGRQKLRCRTRMLHRESSCCSKGVGTPIVTWHGFGVPVRCIAGLLEAVGFAHGSANIHFWRQMPVAGDVHGRSWCFRR